MLNSSFWNHLTGCRGMSSGLFETLPTPIRLQIIYVKYSGTTVIEQSSTWIIRSSTKNMNKKFLNDRTNVRSSNTRFEPMKTERARMTAEANRTRQNGWPSLPEQHCFSFRINRYSNILLGRIMFDNRGSTIYIYIYIKQD